jgi:hypothetical protein
MNKLNISYINLSHILFGGPLLTYIGYKKDKTETSIFKLLLVSIVLLFLYHGYKLFLHYTKHKYISYVNLFHLLVLVPLLLYVYIRKEKVVYPTYDLLFILGVGIIISFSLKVIQ